MSSVNEPALPSPAEVELHGFYVTANNSFHIALRLDDGAYLRLDAPSGSDEHDRILETLEAITRARLASFVAQGLVITGMTEVEAEQGEAEVEPES